MLNDVNIKLQIQSYNLWNVMQLDEKKKRRTLDEILSM